MSSVEYHLPTTRILLSTTISAYNINTMYYCLKQYLPITWILLSKTISVIHRPNQQISCSNSNRYFSLLYTYSKFSRNNHWWDKLNTINWRKKKHCMRVFFSLSKRYYNMLIWGIQKSRAVHNWVEWSLTLALLMLRTQF